LCIDSVDEARAADACFGDIRAYIASIEAPKFPFTVDHALADRGRAVFDRACARCHRTPSAYPKLAIRIEEVGADPVLAVGAGQFSSHSIDWFNQSFDGEMAKIDTPRALKTLQCVARYAASADSRHSWRFHDLSPIAMGKVSVVRYAPLQIYAGRERVLQAER
jgi:hypothetical protein